MSRASVSRALPGEASTPWDHVESELLRSADALTGPLSLEKQADLALKLVERAAGVDRASISLLDPFTGRLRLAASFGIPQIQAGTIVAGPRSVSEWVLTEGRGIVLQGRVLTPRIQGMGDVRIRSTISLPLGGVRGPFGVLSLGRGPALPAFAESDLAMATAALAPLSTALAHRIETDRAIRCLTDLHASSYPAGSPWRTRPLASSHFECAVAARRSWEHGGALVASVPGYGGARSILAADVGGFGVRAIERARLLEGMFLATAPGASNLSELAGQLDRAWALSFEHEQPCEAWLARVSGAGSVESCPMGSGTLHRLTHQEAPTPILGGVQMALGAKRGVTLRIDYHRLLPGDVLVYSNFATLEASDPAGEPYGIERMRECLAEVRSRPPESMVSQLCDSVLAHTGRSRWCHDLLSVAVRFNRGSN